MPHPQVQNARILYEQGRLREAHAACEACLRAAPNNFDAWLLLGSLAVAARSIGDALAAFGRAAELRPNHLEALGNLGTAQLCNGDFALAAATFRRALSRYPAVAALHHNLGAALRQCGDLAGAEASYARALALEPDRAGAHRDRAAVLEKLGRFDAALAAARQAVALDPTDALAHYNVGVILDRLGRLEEACEAYANAGARNPQHAEAFNNLGAVLHRLGDLAAAVECFDRALTLRPAFPEALNNRGLALLDRHEPEAALASFARCLTLVPDDPTALNSRAAALTVSKRHDEAAEAYARLVAVAPHFDYAPGSLLFARLGCCDWRDYEGQTAALRAAVGRGERACQPFPFLLASDDPALQRRCAELFVGAECAATAARRTGPYRHERVRVAYLSADFHDHATAYLLAEVLERHDRQRFEITAVSFGPASAGPMRTRIATAVEHFVDVRGHSDSAIATELREREIDIAIDLKGYTQNARPQILAQRPAPLQVAFLGYPGTTGAGYIDYLMADPALVPPAERVHYSERLVLLPDCYQPNDSLRPIREPAPSRAEVGLPEHGFVFCSFNDNYKITPEVFACWMRLLAATPDAVLWLLDSHPVAGRNLRAAAERHGIAPERLVPAPRLPLAEHLARQRCADLFLDTFPVTAHTTASDALWAGLPLLTRRGRSMAARVAASLLGAVGLPELVTDTLAEYEARALSLARDRSALAALRLRLERNRATSPLFDAERFRVHFEAALLAMQARCAAGLPPESFEVLRVY